MEVVGTPDAIALAGPDSARAGGGVVVALDDAPAPAATRVARWWRGTPGAAAADVVLATAGDGLFARSPWPVAAPVFELGEGDDQVALVIGDAAVAAALRARGIEVLEAPRLTLESLARAQVVVHGVGAGAALPGDATAVLAAGRVLVTGGEPSFGLVPGLDHLHVTRPERACDLVEAVLADSAAFEPLRRFARLAAERHRAAVVYPWLARLLAA